MPFSIVIPQNFLRYQNNKNNYNLVCETLQFLDCICGSTTGGLGLLGLYINEKNVGLINQTVESLTEYCQGPCHENQVTYAHNTRKFQLTVFIGMFFFWAKIKMQIINFSNSAGGFVWTAETAQLHIILLERRASQLLAVSLFVLKRGQTLLGRLT